MNKSIVVTSAKKQLGLNGELDCAEGRSRKVEPGALISIRAGGVKSAKEWYLIVPNVDAGHTLEIDGVEVSILPSNSDFSQALHHLTANESARIGGSTCRVLSIQ